MGGVKLKGRPKNVLWATVIGIAASLIAIIASNFSFFKVLEFKTYDLRMNFLQKSRPAPKNVVMFYVDETSLRHMETQGVNWPWPRELYASAVDFCRKGKASAVIFDLFFSENSSYGVEDDETFANGLKAPPPSYFVLFLSNNEQPENARIKNIIQKSSVPFDMPYPSWMLSEKSIMSLPIEPLIRAATAFGNAQVSPDDDGIYRRIPLIEKLNGNTVPSVTLKASSDIKGVQKILWPAPTKFLFGDTVIPLDEDGRMMINFYGSTDTFPNVSLAKVLVANAAINAGQAPEIDPSIVKDKVVIIGLAAPGLYDLKPTPLSRVYPGPEIHATVIENLLTSDFIRPTHKTTIITITIAVGIIAALGLAVFSSSWGVGLWLILFILGLVSATALSFWRGVWMPFVPPFIALSLSAFTMILKNYLTEGRKKREIRHAFGQYLSPHIVNKIAHDPSSLILGGTTQEVSLFFSDIADFTTISEKISPAELVSKLNEYFSATTKIIQEHSGTLDKYIGDAVMAFWGAPLVIKDHAAQSVLAAMEIQKILATDSEFITRIGIHTGPAVVGNIGSDIRFNYTAIGDTVNLASRLEGLGKKFGTRIIISESTFSAAADSIEARRIGRVRVKGRSEPIGIFEPIGIGGEFGRFDLSSLKTFNGALELFESANFKEALKIFSQITLKLDDGVSQSYQKLCREYLEKPPQEFDGVINFTTK